MNKYIASIFIGIISGFLAGFQGIAGSFYILTMLMLFGVAKNQKMAAGTTLLTIVFPLSIGAVITYYKKGDVDVPVAFTILASYVLAATLGAKFNYMVHEKYVLLSIAFMMIISAGYYIHKFMKLNK
jgi:uncharacterized membrane protein YfcA